MTGQTTVKEKLKYSIQRGKINKGDQRNSKSMIIKQIELDVDILMLTLNLI